MKSHLRLLSRIVHFLAYLALFVVGAPSLAQAIPAPPPAGTAVRLPDLPEITEIHSPWRVRVGDDPRFADPGFDDRAWALVPPAGRIPGSSQLPLSDGFIWARLHLHFDHLDRQPALALVDAAPLPYTVFANGIEVGESPGMQDRVLYRVQPFAVPLPRATDIVIAVRFYKSRVYFRPNFPVGAVRLGPLSDIRLWTALARTRGFDQVHVAEVVAEGLCFAMAVFALFLYFAQRSQPEYLWLSLFCFFYGGCLLMKTCVEAGFLSEGPGSMIVYRYLGCIAMVCSLQFVMRFAHIVTARATRAVEGMFLLLPLIGLWREFIFDITVVIFLAVLFIHLTTYLFMAYRRRISEIKLLLPFLSLMVLVNVYFFASTTLPSVFPPFRRLELGSIGVGAEDLTVPLFLAGVLAVVLYRFNRVSREEQRAAAEFDAARTVQKLLIPEESPQFPGFQIGTVYQPAQEVGGDFFQIIRASDDSAALVIVGDVSGKGLQAAMTVAVIVGTLRTLIEFTTSPSHLMAGLNRHLGGRGVGFTTCTILRLSPSGVAIACSAGHIEPYLDGEPLNVDPALPLGVSDEGIYPELDFTFAPGQILTLVTDGVVEARDPHTLELFGFGRTQAISKRPAREIVDAVMQFGQNTEQGDDITVVTIAHL